MTLRLIGKTGFEPATPWSQTRCSTKLSYFPLTGCIAQHELYYQKHNYLARKLRKKIKNKDDNLYLKTSREGPNYANGI